MVTNGSVIFSVLVDVVTTMTSRHSVSSPSNRAKRRESPLPAPVTSPQPPPVVPPSDMSSILDNSPVGNKGRLQSARRVCLLSPGGFKVVDELTDTPSELLPLLYIAFHSRAAAYCQPFVPFSYDYLLYMTL